jgi:signal transduction histidine kinase
MGHDMRLWPMLSLLLIVILVPTACLLWFMDRAIENERLAVRKTLEDACRRDLSDAQTRLGQFWQGRVTDLNQWSTRQPASAVFAHCIRSGWADGVVCYDEHGQVIYPASPVNPSDQNQAFPSDWANARHLENDENNPMQAAQAYAAIARETDDVNLVARALQAQARCLVQSGDRQSAIEIVTGPLADEKYARAIDPQGRLIVPNAQLMALQLMEDRHGPTFNELVQRLQNRLGDYSDPTMSGSQRRFLMQELKHLLPDEAELPLLPAEDLAARFIELDIPPANQDTQLHTSRLPGVWQLAISGGRFVALLRTDTILSQTSRVIAQSELPGEVAITLRPPNAESAATEVFYSLPAGNYLPNWQLTLSWAEGGPTDALANRRIATYLWTGVLVIALISVLAGLMARAFRDQMRHARLKNDLVATVSHELKTPLSSIRLLVDTLLDEKSPDLDKTREYLQLVAKENMRLSRLIDNFLAFSRMERNKYPLQLTETSLARIINDAIDAVRERFDRPDCRFEVELSDNLPNINADADALITVVLNLLDNAYKYTGEQKHIVLRAYAEGKDVCIAVTDNGMGLSRTAAKKVFERFYQADRRLSRSTGGCGLGLSIVKFIVNAHGGTIEVASRPNIGSTFTVRLPCLPTIMG